MPLCSCAESAHESGTGRGFWKRKKEEKATAYRPASDDSDICFVFLLGGSHLGVLVRIVVSTPPNHRWQPPAFLCAPCLRVGSVSLGPGIGIASARREANSRTQPNLGYAAVALWVACDSAPNS
jgi:hypothetical protein